MWWSFRRKSIGKYGKLIQCITVKCGVEYVAKYVPEQNSQETFTQHRQAKWHRTYGAAHLQWRDWMEPKDSLQPQSEYKSNFSRVYSSIGEQNNASNSLSMPAANIAGSNIHLLDQFLLYNVHFRFPVVLFLQSNFWHNQVWQQSRNSISHLFLARGLYRTLSETPILWTPKRCRLPSSSNYILLYWV